VKSVNDTQQYVSLTITYTLVVTDLGPATARGVVVSDPLPAQLQFVTAVTPTQGIYDGQTGIWDVGTLPDGGQASLQVVARILGPGTIVNTAEVSSVTVDPDLTNNTSSVTVTASWMPPSMVSKQQYLASTPAPADPPTFIFVGPPRPSVPRADAVNLADELYVMQLYQDLLQRPADAAGLATWSGLLNQGVSRAQVALDIEQSLEYRQDEVQALYARYLHRNADPAGLAALCKFLVQGGTVEQVAADLVASPEYYQKRGGGTFDGFLAALYQDALERSIDPAGQAGFDQALAAGSTRAQVAMAIFSSTEYRQDLIHADYLTWLHRPANAAGLAILIFIEILPIRDSRPSRRVSPTDQTASSFLLKQICLSITNSTKRRKSVGASALGAARAQNFCTKELTSLREARSRLSL